MDFKYDIEKCDVANKVQLAEYHQILSDWHNWMFNQVNGMVMPPKKRGENK